MQSIHSTGGGDAHANLGALSIDAFCRAHSISRRMFYVLLKQGKGPRIMRIGTRVLVSAEAAAEWRRAMEAA